MENTARRQPEVDRACKPKTPPAGTKEPSSRKPSRQLKTPVYVENQFDQNPITFPPLHEMFDVYLCYMDFKSLNPPISSYLHIMHLCTLCIFAQIPPKKNHSLRITFYDTFTFYNCKKNITSFFKIWNFFFHPPPFTSTFCMLYLFVIPPEIPKPYSNFLSSTFFFFFFKCTNFVLIFCLNFYLFFYFWLVIFGHKCFPYYKI